MDKYFKKQNILWYSKENVIHFGQNRFWKEIPRQCSMIGRATRFFLILITISYAFSIKSCIFISNIHKVFKIVFYKKKLLFLYRILNASYNCPILKYSCIDKWLICQKWVCKASKSHLLLQSKRHRNHLTLTIILCRVT